MDLANIIWEYGCPISSKITKLLFMSNIYSEVKRLSQNLYHLNYPFKVYISLP